MHICPPRNSHGEGGEEEETTESRIKWKEGEGARRISKGEGIRKAPRDGKEKEERREKREELERVEERAERTNEARKTGESGEEEREREMAGPHLRI